MADTQDTIAAVATPSGRGGIGIVRVSGGKSLNIARNLTGATPPPRQACYSAFRDCANGIIDKGVLLYFQGPGSFTGEDVIELQGHGGQLVLNMLLQRVIDLGARHARPGEFTERAFLNGKIDLLQAEAVADLIDSSSEQAARSAMRSLEGEFSSSISGLREQLVDIRVQVEGSLDFSVEELDLLDAAGIRDRLHGAVQALEQLLKRARQGRRLRRGMRAVIVGRPNVGKSSLLNRLAQSERAIVTAVPGTTRDIIEDHLLIKGVPITITDTAGIHEAQDIVEQEGVRRALAETERADVVLVVTEYRLDNREDISGLLNTLPSGRHIILIHNKIDLENRAPGISSAECPPAQVYVSAKTGAGIDLLETLLRETAGIENSGEDVLLARSRHINALEQAKRCLESGMLAHEEGGAVELLAEELRKAQQMLAKITGEYTTDDLLGEIFSRFCVGK